jgi:hypothetical protein
VRRTGDGECASVAFRIRVARAQQGKIEKLSRLEFEIFGFLKIKSSRTGAESLLSFQLCFVGRHRSSIASLVSLGHKVRSTHSRLVEDIRGFYDWMTYAEGLLFPKPPLVFTGIISRSLSDSRLRNLAMGTDTQRGEIGRDRWVHFIFKKLAFEF